MNTLRFLLPSALLISAAPLFAATHLVDSLAALQSRILASAPGDTIVMKNGTYTTSAAISIRRSGAPEMPITITAESVGGVEIAGTHGFTITAPASHIVVQGFVFTHASGRMNVGAGTTHVRVTRNVFRCSGDGAYLTVAGDDARIDHNEFADKRTPGSMLAIGGSGSQVARRLWIHHNYFHDFTGLGSSGAEMLRYGLTALSESQGGGIVEHNLFARCRGESELISSRASGIIYRYNTFVESPSAQFTLRHGHACEVHGNILRQTEGLRVFGDRHRIHSNYLEGNYIGLVLGNGSADVASGGSPSAHDRPDDCQFIFNTLVDNRTHYQMSRRPDPALGAIRTTFANNLLVGGATGAKLEGPYAEGVWGGNVLWNVAAPGDLPPDSYEKRDPRLAPGADGLLRPTTPADLAATFTNVEADTDLDGQPRARPGTVGADEPSAEPALARLLTPADVGPAAGAAESPVSADATPPSPAPEAPTPATDAENAPVAAAPAPPSPPSTPPATSPATTETSAAPPAPDAQVEEAPRPASDSSLPPR